MKVNFAIRSRIKTAGRNCSRLDRHSARLAANLQFVTRQSLKKKNTLRSRRYLKVYSFYPD